MMQTRFTAALLAAALLTGSGVAIAEEESLTQWWFSPWRHKEVQPVDNKVYKEECGGCHLAYQPGLLPTKSWEKLLTETALADHFGDDATLDAETLKEVRDYALANAADKSYHKRSRKIALATATGDAPLR
ncbi:MAG: cytochrome C, partial [Gallionellales bacterium GWA2_59_43]